MARIQAHLEDENEELVVTLGVESDDEYDVCGYFKTADGGLYLIAEVKEGEPPIDVELTAVSIDGPHPTSLVGRL